MEKLGRLALDRMANEGVRFTLPEAADGKGWTRLIDTNLPDGGEGDEAVFKIGDAYDVTGRSFLLFLLQAEGRQG